jgi:hypothetical protein
MLYDVGQISDLTKVSKVTIYSKLKLKEIKQHIVTRQGKSYVDEEGFKLIKDSLNLTKNLNSSLNNDNDDIEVNQEISMDSDGLINLKEDLINTLKDEVEFLKQEIHEKNKQLENKDDLLKNMQILLGQEQQKPKQDLLQMEAHFKQLDDKLIQVREKMQERAAADQQPWYKKIFK